MSEKPIKDLTLTELLNKLGLWALSSLFFFMAGTMALLFVLSPSFEAMIFFSLFGLPGLFFAWLASK